MITNSRLFGLAAIALAAFVMGVSASAFAATDGTCSGGSIASGVYSNLNVSGLCTVDAGPVSVRNNLTVQAGGTLIASYGGTDKGPAASNLNITGNLYVLTGGILVLGCEPVNYVCVNDPDQAVGTYFTRDRVGGSIIAEDALVVIVHLSIVDQDVTVTGGGGGVSCAGSIGALGGSPPYGDFEDVIIGGNVSITGWQSCWLGFFRDTVALNVDFNDNLTADPDGNEMGTNSILGNLKCAGNSPTPQLGDSGGSLSNVFGRAHGQCASSGLVR